jgi:hypothetical protein
MDSPYESYSQGSSLQCLPYHHQDYCLWDYQALDLE